MIRVAQRGAQRGFSIIEIMVGIVIGLLAVLVTYQLFNVSETFKRNTTSLADTQQNGLLSSFLMSLQLANANNGLAVAGTDLDSCPSDGTAPDTQIKSTLRPIPVMITDSGDDMTPDKFVVNYGSTSRLIIPANFKSLPSIPIDGNFVVQSPTGFMKGDQVVIIEPNTSGAGRCAMTTVTDIYDGLETAPVDDSAGATAAIATANGYVSLHHAANLPSVSYNADSVVLNLGPTPQRIQYDVTSETLRSTDLLSGNAPQPVASNVVNLKAQYGIDTNNDGLADKWVKAVDGADGDFSPAGVLAMSYADLSRIKAVRLAIVVRSDQFDRSLGDWSPSPAVFSDCGEFACPAALSMTYAAPTAPAGNYRYRVYETIIPLRNAIWNIEKK
ncbi:MAG: PilW family protein [Proteobacteria bacterium]|nr:PilW family protein [Pseudomonadota bacterium]